MEAHQFFTKKEYEKVRAGLAKVFTTGNAQRENYTAHKSGKQISNFYDMLIQQESFYLQIFLFEISGYQKSANNEGVHQNRRYPGLILLNHCYYLLIDFLCYKSSIIVIVHSNKTAFSLSRTNLYIQVVIVYLLLKSTLSFFFKSILRECLS